MRHSGALLALGLCLGGCCLEVTTGIDRSTGTGSAGSSTGTSGIGTTSSGTSAGGTSSGTSAGASSSGATSSGGTIDPTTLFYPPVNYAVGMPHSLTAFQDDGGVIGLATADYWGEWGTDGIGDGLVSILLGTGAGTFQPSVQIGQPGSEFEAICSADFDGDGLADLAAGSYGSATPLTTFGSADRGMNATLRDQALTGLVVHHVACGSVSSAGHADLIVAASDGVHLGLGNGAGGFSWSGAYGFGDARASVVASLGYSRVAQVAVADNGHSQVFVLGFAPAGFGLLAGPWAVGAAPVGIAAADFNGDGCPDLATANNADDTVSVLLSQCPAGPSPTIATYTLERSDIPCGEDPICGRPQNVVAADFNGDGALDLAVPLYDALPSGANVVLLINQGDGTFGAPIYLTAHQNPSWSVTADFNGDGKADLAVSNWVSHDVSVFIHR